MSEIVQRGAASQVLRLLAAGPDEPGPGRCYALVPSRRRPRWLLPVDSRAHAARAAVLYRPYRGRGAVAAAGLQAAARAGLLRSYPHQIHLEQRPALEAYLARLLGDSDIRLAIHAGREDRHRPTLSVAAVGRHSVEAVARVACSVEGGERVRREAAGLALARDLGVRVPKVIHQGTVTIGDLAEAPLVVQRAEGGRTSRPAWTLEHEQLLSRLEHGKPRPVAESALVRDLRGRVAADPALASYADTLERAIETLGSWQHRPVLNHRDFAPWNLLESGPSPESRTNGDAPARLTVIDWEFAEPDGLPHLDRFYFDLASGVLLMGWGASEVAEYALSWPGRIDLPHHLARALTTVLLVERIAWRHEQDANLASDTIAAGCQQALLALAEEASDARAPRRLRVLMSAYACEPNRGSEPGVGWNWALQAAKDHEVWVLTRANNREVIEGELARQPVPHLHFLYHDLPEWILPLKRVLPFGTQLYYELWQRTALGKAREAHLRLRFDLTHHITFVSCRVPSYLHRMPVPHVWGPVGGVELVPVRMWPMLGARGAASEAIRSLGLQISQRRLSIRTCARRSAVVLAATHETRSWLDALGASAEVEPAIAESVARGTDPECADIPSSAPSLRLIYVGRLVPLKGLSLAIEAVARAVSEGILTTLTLVGDGPDRKRLTALARRLRVDDRVTSLGGLPYQAVAEQYRQHDALIFPSLHDSGGMVVLEAMAAGLPPIVLDVGGPGLLVTTDCGVKVPVTTRDEVVKGLSAGIAYLADPELRQRMSAETHRHLEANHSWDRKREVIRAVYRRAVESRTGVAH